ncbi:hypothetical protein E8E14_005342 [Neopestalotiopsis sp. 37M]|nr:hypothetical protein E8E14_005342 [Neopestalotiopsis sp. 37M]
MNDLGNRARDEQAPSSVVDGLLSEISSLRESIVQLNAVLATTRHGLDSNPSAPLSSFSALLPTAHNSLLQDNNQSAHGAIIHEATTNTHEALESTLDSIQYASPVARARVDSSHDHISIWPTRYQSYYIIQFAISELGWIHCAVSASEFMSEHETMWNAVQKGDTSLLNHHSWMSVYYSLLATGAYYMDEAVAAEIMGEVPAGDDIDIPINVRYARKWYYRAMHELKQADFEFKATIHTAMDAFDDFHSQLPEYFKRQHPGIKESYQYKDSHERRIGWQGFCISIGIDYIRLYAARAAIRPITAAVTAAGIYMALSLLFLAPDNVEDLVRQRVLVKQAIEYLAKAGRISEQPQKSSQLLSYLLHVGERHTSTHTIDSLEELVNHIKDAKKFMQAANESHEYHQENSNSTTTRTASSEQIFGLTGIEGVSAQTLDNFSFVET